MLHFFLLGIFKMKVDRGLGPRYWGWISSKGTQPTQFIKKSPL